ncbi:MAG TPA: response regulator [Polyangiaceae bacterium]|nr:response regulator [Polyangiaceae bacterium]
MVVDDNEQNRALARATLEEEGFDVVLAKSGEEALAVFAKRQPDCVLLDVRMPGMDGFAVCARIRQLPEGSDVPVVFLTALRDVDTFDAALRAGGDDFLTKPVRPTELLLRVQAALKVRRLNATNREYYETVRRQRDDLMRLQLQKERLMAFVVHDLKNPVSTIDLHAQLLLRDRELPTRARGAALSIRDEVRSMMRLILNLLDISKSEEGRLSPAFVAVEPRELVNQVFEALEVRALANGMTLESDIEALSIRADADLLRRVIENLLENALRHAPENSVVRVSGRKDVEGFELRVADTGRGVPEELRESIFERFVQLEHGDRTVTRSGRGLGLAFCQLAVEAHGGRIWVEDGAPGAVFCVRLPHDA